MAAAMQGIGRSCRLHPWQHRQQQQWHRGVPLLLLLLSPTRTQQQQQQQQQQVVSVVGACLLAVVRVGRSRVRFVLMILLQTMM
jgi:hypothetical protein